MIPCKEKLNTSLSEAYYSYTAYLKRLLESQDYVACTADVWSTKTECFLGISAHYVIHNFIIMLICLYL